MTTESRRRLAGDGMRVLIFFGLVAIAIFFVAFLPFPESVKIWLSPMSVLGVSWLCLKKENKTLSSIGLRQDAKFYRELLFGVLVGMAIIFATAFPIVLFGGFTFVRAADSNLGTLFFPFVPFLAAGILEELVFRGYAFQSAVRGLGKAPALLLFALLFVAVHLGNPGMEGSTKVWACLDIGLASVLLGLAWIRTASLALPIGIHVGWNWAQGGILGVGVSGTKSTGFFSPVYLGAPKWMTGGDFGLEASLPAAIACLAACAVLVVWRAGNQKDGTC